MFDANGSGVIHCKHFFPLLRDLGYNVHKEQAWYYMNKLELSGLSRDFRKKDVKKVILSIDNIPLTLRYPIWYLKELDKMWCTSIGMFKQRWAENN